MTVRLTLLMASVRRIPVTSKLISKSERSRDDRLSASAQVAARQLRTAFPNLAVRRAGGDLFVGDKTEEVRLSWTSTGVLEAALCGPAAADLFLTLAGPMEGIARSSGASRLQVLGQIKDRRLLERLGLQVASNGGGGVNIGFKAF